MQHYANVGWAELARPLTGQADQLEPGDVTTFLEDPDARPYLWEMED
ncbi:MAG: hypothetical protein GWO24_16965 [Akkermansiaceae bacterium]|nr:hypothetical protein [Akkermansiaceae bacterium]